MGSPTSAPPAPSSPADHRPAAAEPPARVALDIDIDAPGRHHGYLTVPWSRDESAWGSVLVPLTVVNGSNGPGPTLLFTGGNHGDEYEGPIALMKLATELDPAQIAGRVIIVPAMNLPAVLAASRVSPVDSVNMNRAFPGSRTGGVSAMICAFVTEELIARADAVVDIHAGGKTLDFVPSAVVHALPDPDLMRRTLAALQAFGAPLGLVLTELDSAGMLDTVVEQAGKVFVSTELGGKGLATAETVAIADRGVRNMLRHFGLMEGAPDAPVPTRLMHTPDAGCFIQSRHAGLFEPLVDLGAEVRAGQPVARVHPVEESGGRASVYHAARDGLFYCRHARGLIKRGDCLAVLAVDLPT